MWYLPPQNVYKKGLDIAEFLASQRTACSLHRHNIIFHAQRSSRACLVYEAVLVFHIFPNAHAGMIRIRDQIVSKFLYLFSKHNDVSTCKLIDLAVLLNTNPNKARLTKLRQSVLTAYPRSCALAPIHLRRLTVIPAIICAVAHRIISSSACLFLAF